MSQAKDTYRTLKGRSESLYKVKGSKHFGYAFPAYSKEEVSEHLETIKKEHHSARHHCYAYRLGLDKDVYRANDDGEPSNSAGKPILGQIQSFDLTNVFIVVVRYFGGVKLGVGGLIDAYRNAAKMAIESGDIVERTVMNTYRINFEYPQMSEVMGLLKGSGLEFRDQVFEMECSLLTDVRLSASETFEAQMNKVDNLELELIQTA
ncbi:MAG: YigZ family protein [Flavobacteriales bacterium]|nr:YigZ family protein [Flavobacteriales bacterium]